MKIECDLSEEDKKFLDSIIIKMKLYGYIINRVYRDENEDLIIQFNSIVLS